MEKIFNATYTIIPNKLWYDGQNRIFKFYGDRYISADEIQGYKTRTQRNGTCSLELKMNKRWHTVLYYTNDYAFRDFEIAYVIDKFVFDGKEVKHLKETGYFTTVSKEARKALEYVEKKYTPKATPTTTPQVASIKTNPFAEIKENPVLFISGIIGAIVFTLLVLL